jgi:hypothetical protein
MQLTPFRTFLSFTILAVLGQYFHFLFSTNKQCVLSAFFRTALLSLPIEILGLEVACIYACRTIKMDKNDGVTIS